MNAYQIRYLRIWRRAFLEFFGWAKEETACWAQPLLERMDPPGMVINDPPLYYVARELASKEDYYDRLSQRKRSELIDEIEKILDGNVKGRVFPKDFDFLRAKKKIEKLLRAKRPMKRKRKS